jgi:hypothetical protein
VEPAFPAREIKHHHFGPLGHVVPAQAVIVGTTGTIVSSGVLPAGVAWNGFRGALLNRCAEFVTYSLEEDSTCRMIPSQ